MSSIVASSLVFSLGVMAGHDWVMAASKREGLLNKPLQGDPSFLEAKDHLATYMEKFNIPKNHRVIIFDKNSGSATVKRGGREYRYSERKRTKVEKKGAAVETTQKACCSSAIVVPFCEGANVAVTSASLTLKHNASLVRRFNARPALLSGMLRRRVSPMTAKIFGRQTFAFSLQTAASAACRRRCFTRMSDREGEYDSGPVETGGIRMGLF